MEYNESKIIIETSASQLAVFPGWFPPENCDILIQHVLGLNLVVKPTFQQYGKTNTMHRNIGFFSDVSAGYRYSNQIMSAQALTPMLQQVLDQVNQASNCSFNGILINVYQDGSDYISAHSDDERDLDNGMVLALSLGAERKFRVRHKQDKTKAEVITTNGQLLCMAGKFQQEFTHEIPKQAGVGLRISLTFRRHV